MSTEKQISAIEELTLCDATFNGCKIKPTYINFFFGNNGVGKTTISRLIKRCRKPANELPNPATQEPNAVFSGNGYSNDYNILVYNKDFIDSNIQQFGNLPGVFTMNEDNIAIQGQIEEALEEKEKADTEVKNYALLIEEKGKEQNALYEKLREDCWEKSEAIRAAFPETQAGVKRDKKKFLEKLLAISTPSAHDQAALKTLYDTAFDPNARIYPLFQNIETTDVLDNMDGISLLEKPITSSSDTDFSRFIKAINATDWIRQGHSHFSDVTDGKCPYCQQVLPTDFEKQLSDCFDEQYQADILKLTALLTSYKSVANELFIPLQDNEKDVFPKIDTTEYEDKLEILRSAIKENIQSITSKINEPSTVVSLRETKFLMEELNDIVAVFNARIEENNNVVSSKQQNQAKCTKSVWELIAYLLKSDIDSYNKGKSDLADEIKNATDGSKNSTAQSEKMKLLIADLSSKIKNTADTVKSMNKLLSDSGFQGFSIREKTGVKNVYEVIREDGSVATMLSEGERNFIAFLYFYHLVHGNGNIGDAQVMYGKDGEQQVLTDGSDSRDKIVVIDDPVSSMDSASLFIVSSLVREMISICHNNVSLNDEQYKAKYIKQIFILTHNAYFHREVTVNQERHFRYVSFYLITKTDNTSTVRLCTRKKISAPTDLENYNPVQNSYAALWTEYKEVSTSIPLMNVMRRILEYYFIQICGYEGTKLQDKLLKENKDKFIITDPNTGAEDTTYLQIASSLLLYISSNTFGINDGLHYVDDCMDIEQCRETFEMIFRHMDQAQHFEMMMGIN